MIAVVTQSILEGVLLLIFKTSNPMSVQQWSIPPFITILLPMALPLLQLILVGSPLTLFYTIYMFSIDPYTEVNTAQTQWVQVVSLLAIAVEVVSTALGLIEVVLVMLSDVSMADIGTSSAMISLAVYWCIAQGL